MSKKLDLVGQQFGRLEVIATAPSTANGRSQFVAECKCGNTTTVIGKDLVRGHTTSCGCFKAETQGKHRLAHGESRPGTAEFRSWKAMLTRCYNPNQDCWPNYGGRGIKVCDRWRDSYEAFLADMGRKPSPSHSLDRFPDNNGDYEPGNCRWATRAQQNANQRRSKTPKD